MIIKNLYFKLFLISFVVFFLMVFHKAIPLVLLPAITNGDIINFRITSYKGLKARGYKSLEITYPTPIIAYRVNGKEYIIDGAPNSFYPSDNKVEVIYSRIFPKLGMHKSLLGCLDGDMITNWFIIWFAISGVLFALSKHTFFALTKPLPFWKYFSLSFIIILIPFAPWIDYFSDAEFIQGEVTNETTRVETFERYYINYTYRDSSYNTITSSEFSSNMPGDKVSVWLKKGRTESAVELSFFTFYTKPFIAFILLGLIFMYVWYKLSNQWVKITN